LRKDEVKEDYFRLARYWTREVVLDAYNDLEAGRYRFILETNSYLRSEISEKRKQKELDERMCNAFVIIWHQGEPKDRAPIFKKRDQLLPTAEEIEKEGYDLIFQSPLSYHCYYIYIKSKELGITPEKFIDRWINQLLDRMRTLGGKRIWWMFHGGQPIASTWPEGFFSKKDAYQWFEDYILSGKSGINIFAGKDKRFGSPEEKRKVLKIMRSYPSPHRYLTKRGLNRDNCNLMSFTMRCFMVHYCFEWGTKAVIVNDKSAVNIQLLIAFARGAAKQYDGYWGYMDELAEAWRCRNGRVLWSYLGYNKEGERIGGISPTNIMNRWIVTFFSGANFIIQQQSRFAFYKPFYNYHKTKKIELTPMGERAREFSEFVLKNHPDRGKTLVPLALMLEHEHGWAPFLWNNIAKRVTWGCIPYEEADYMVDNFFEVVFPGFRENPPLGPWNSLKEMDEAFRRGDDTKAYEHKWLTESPFGDSFDVVLENCSLDVLKNYSGVILLGGIRLNSSLLGKLKEYVSEGGLLVVNVAQLDLSEKEIEENFGVCLSGMRKGAIRSKCEICGEEFNEELYSYKLLEVKNAEIQATNEYKDSLIVTKKLGKGSIILTSPYYLQTHNRERFLKIGKHLLSHIMDRFLPVKIVGSPIEYLINKTNKGFIITLLNHRQEDWIGKIVLKNSRGFRIEALDRWKDERIGIEEGKAVAPIRIPRYQFGIYEIKITPKEES